MVLTMAASIFTSKVVWVIALCCTLAAGQATPADQGQDQGPAVRTRTGDLLLYSAANRTIMANDLDLLGTIETMVSPIRALPLPPPKKQLCAMGPALGFIDVALAIRSFATPRARTSAWLANVSKRCQRWLRAGG